jgi:NAD(P)-dependent dehydrogenase (short-subunit alcohol dehydrogenase family)
MASTRVLITGANTGIGLATAKKLVQSGADVILACRNPAKAADARSQLLALGGTGKVDVIELDLSSLESVKAAATLVNERYGSLDVLINNAGLVVEELQHTAEGYEQQFGVNYVGPFLLTQLLLPALNKAPAGRIIHLASIMHWLGRIKPETFRTESAASYKSVAAYGQSKLANLLFSKALARQLAGTTVTSNALHPGGVDSEIYRELPKLQYAILKPFLIPTSRPANLITQMAIGAEWAGRNGTYVSAQMPPWQSKHAKNDQLGDQLYQQSMDMIKEYL